MLNNIKEELVEFCPSHSNWGVLFLWNSIPFYDIVISGVDCELKRKDFGKYYIHNKILAGGAAANNLPLLKERNFLGKTTITLCMDKICKLPVHEVKDAIEQINT